MNPAGSRPVNGPIPAFANRPDAIVRVVLACVCGSDLWYYRGDSEFSPGPIGHEFIGVVEDVGAEVSNRTLVSVPGSGHSDETLSSLLTLSDVMAATTPPSARTSRPAKRSRSSATAPSGSPACSPPSVSAQSASSPCPGTPTANNSAQEFGATDIVAARGDDAVARIKELTGGVDATLECVGTGQAMQTALDMVVIGAGVVTTSMR